MTHPDIVEAVAIVRASPSIAKHKDGPAMVKLIDDYAKAEKISFKSMPGTQYGSSGEGVFFQFPFIDINDSFVGDAATTAFVLAHEAHHRVINRVETLESELDCRALEAAFGAELIAGLTYSSPGAAAGAKAVASVTGSALAREIATSVSAGATNRVLDRVLKVAKYVPFLKLAWVKANFRTYGGGLSNREAGTLGHFVRVLSVEAFGANMNAIVDILEAIPPAGWPDAKKAIGDLKPVREHLRKGYNAMVLGSRINACEKRFGENLRA